MTTVDDFEQYTGVMGSVSVGGTTLADVEYDVKWRTGTVTYPRGSKYSDGAIPGKRDVTTTLKKVLVRTEALILLGYSMTDTPLTGTAMALKAGASVTADAFIASTTPTITTPSRVRLTVKTSAMTTLGTVTLVGTMANGTTPQTEILTVGLLSVDEYVTSSKVFKTLTGITVTTLRSTGNGVLNVDAIAGSTTMTFGSPKIFDLIGSLTKSTHVITITQPDCWFSEGGIAWTDAGVVVSVNLPVAMHDPDLLSMTQT